MEIEGRVLAVLPIQSGVAQSTGNAWQSQEFMLEYFWFPNQTRPSNAAFRIFGEDRIKEWNLKVGEEVKVRYHIEAREYNGRWYNDVRCDNVTRIGASARQAAFEAAQGNQTGEAANNTTATEQTPQTAQFPPKVDENGNPVNAQANDLPF